MRLGTWLCAAALLPALACGDDDGGGAGGESQAVANALTDNIRFRGGVLRRGAIPESDADTVRLSQDEATVRIVPGQNVLMSLDVDNPDQDDDPVTATLMQFDGSSDHTEVEAGDAGDTQQIEFDVEDDVCDALCNKVFSIPMIQAVKLGSGKVSRKLNRTFRLDCSDHGDRDRCAGSGDARDSGTSGGGSGGTGGGGNATVASELVSAVARVNATACMTCSTTAPNSTACPEAPYPAEDLECLRDAVLENAAVRTSAVCLDRALDTAIADCAGAASAACPPDSDCFAAAVGTAWASCPSNDAFTDLLEGCRFRLAQDGGAPAVDAGAQP